MNDIELLSSLGINASQNNIKAWRIATLINCGIGDFATARLLSLQSVSMQRTLDDAADIQYDAFARIASLPSMRSDKHFTTHYSRLKDARALVERTVAAGLALYGIASSPRVLHLSVGEAWNIVKCSQVWGQSITYSNKSVEADPNGFLSWAWIGDSLSKKAQMEIPLRIGVDEWNEGSILWFKDISASEGASKELRLDLAVRLFPRAERILVSVQSRSSGKRKAIEITAQDRRELYNLI